MISLHEWLSTVPDLQITLTMDLEAVADNRKTYKQLPATLSFADQHGNLQELPLTVSSRGRFRRRICDFQPLKLNFSKKDLRSRGLSEFDKIKLVTHCNDSRKAEALLREYVTYQLYQQLTPQSFKVKLARITYRDVDSNHSIQTFAILLEPAKEMAQRIGGTICKNCINEEPSSFNQTALYRHGVFQYVIGNCDWSTVMPKNMKLVRLDQTGELIPVPYDFDFSGLVNADYAIPNPDYYLRSIKDRIYLGPTQQVDLLQQAVDNLQQHHDQWMEIISEHTYIRSRTKKEMNRYLESCFYHLELEPLLHREIIVANR